MPQGLRDTGQQRVSWQEFPIEEYKWACPHWVLQGSTEPPAAISPCPELRKGAGPAQKLVSDDPACHGCLSQGSTSQIHHPGAQNPPYLSVALW